MGLDITAFRQATYLAKDGDADAMYDRGYHYAYVNGDFAQRADGRESGFYDAADEISFRAGSYSGYNDWRAWLSRIMLGVEPEIVWNNPAEYGDKPFFELIHFADNEGIIGPGPAKRLAEAFAAHDERAREHGGEYYYPLYQTWRQAFEMAADNGLVSFH